MAGLVVARDQHDSARPCSLHALGPLRDRRVSAARPSGGPRRARCWSPSRCSARGSRHAAPPARAAPPGRAGASPRSAAPHRVAAPIARSQPPACTEGSWPGSPIAMTFAPRCAACSSRRALARVEAIPASSRTTTLTVGQRPAVLDRQQPAVQRPRRDLACSVSSRAARALGATPMHLETRPLVDLAQHAGGVGLAGPGQRLDHIHAVA